MNGEAERKTEPMDAEDLPDGAIRQVHVPSEYWPKEASRIEGESAGLTSSEYWRKVLECVFQPIVDGVSG